MKEKILSSGTWFLNYVAPRYYYKQKMDGELKEKFLQAIKFIGEDLDFESITVEEAKMLRFSKWEDESNLYLFPLYLAKFIPIGMKVTSINNKTNIWKGYENEDLDTRFGCLAVGIKLD